MCNVSHPAPVAQVCLHVLHLFILHTVCACVLLCGWVSLRTTDWVSVVMVENTNLASTSKAVCHFGATLLGAQLTLWTSQHFSLFTVAHAKPPLHLKSHHHVVNSLPKENLHVLPSWEYSLSETQKKKIAIALLQEMLCLLLLLCLLFVVFCRKLTDFKWFSLLVCWQCVYVCRGNSRCYVEKNRSWSSLSLKSDVKSLQHSSKHQHVSRSGWKKAKQRGRKKITERF